MFERSFAGWRLLFLFCLILLFSIGNEFSFSDAIREKENLFQLFNALMVVIFCLGLWFVVFPNSATFTSKLKLKLSNSDLSSFLCSFLFLVSGILLVLKIRRIDRFGLSIDLSLFWALGALLLFLILLCFVTGWAKHKGVVFGLSIVSQFTLVSVSFEAFPLSFDVESQMYLINEAIEVFTKGLNPYQHTSAAISLMPGSWLVFIPNWLLGLNFRWLQELSLIASVVLVYFSGKANERINEELYLPIFILTPFLFLQTDSFFGIVILGFALHHFFIKKEFYLFAAAVLGLSLTVSLFFWLWIPFIAVHLYSRLSLKHWILQAVVTIVLFLLVWVPIQASYPGSFFSNLFSVWQGGTHWEGFNIGYWLHNLIGNYGLVFIQLMIFLITYKTYFHFKGSLSGAYVLFAIFSALVIAINRVVVNDYYMVVIFLLVAGYAGSQDDLTDENAA